MKHSFYGPCVAWIGLMMLCGFWAGNGWASSTDAAWPMEKSYNPKPVYAGVEVGSRYLVMRDGVRIAIDLYLPKGLPPDRKLPTILHQTRYHRSMQLRWPFRALLGGKPFDHSTLYGKRREKFVRRGYAWIDVDARGSGASEGFRVCSWSPDEVRDGAEIVDWIVSQPWSNQRVGAMGISYDGTTAEFLLIHKHPAVRAVAPRFSLYDVYTDIPYPGGIHAQWFTEHWQQMNNALDRNAVHEIAGSWVNWVTTGVHPVDEDKDGSLRAAAIAGHSRNFDVHAEASRLSFRDDISATDPYHAAGQPKGHLPGEQGEAVGSMGVFSPHSYIRDFERSGGAIYSYSGWFDGGYAHAAIKRFLTVRTPGSRLILGPWNHGGGWNCNPLLDPAPSAFDHDTELMRFFDHHLLGVETGIADERPVHYFTMVQEKWKAADTWPPPGAQTRVYRFGPNNSLDSGQAEKTEAFDEYSVDTTVGTGKDSRWQTQVGIDQPVRYPDRKEQDARLLVYDSPPLEHDIEVTGHPIVTLYVSSTADDGTFFVYLEDVAQNGQVAYVTEGQLRAIHRKISHETPPYKTVAPYRTFMRKDAMPLVPGQVAELIFDLLPTSYRFSKGHRLRVAVAGADSSHFAILPKGRPPTLRVHRGGKYLSAIALPVIAEEH